MADLSDDIETNAGGPKKVTVDGNSAEQHALKDQIEADRYLKSQDAMTSPKRGISLARFRHQGTV